MVVIFLSLESMYLRMVVDFRRYLFKILLLHILIETDSKSLPSRLFMRINPEQTDRQTPFDFKTFEN